ncbi:hypothetical protein P1X14_06940 [Sphingomonas sp. AOB5]|uniref:hypothetical protein n=1 Tax=Sphingomonas sp. AOB5 TaxID=3034017 RepID=UPI0023F8A445|nr:hypothetical protein [Sphingomonas sp. AOB5]MDF7774974.1 hypothetical protein [Sphingomonas sp. AOB5]
MSRGPDALTLLARALTAGAEAAGCAVRITASDSVRWASATFTGMRHRITLCCSAGDALDAWLATLPEAEFDLRGHLVADLVVERIRRDGDAMTVELEALTLEKR